jgi:hypothetical protein
VDEALKAPATALGALLEGVVDYAGLFPPAALDMPAAAGEYDAQRRGDDAWMLGRFVVPASRLEELMAAGVGGARWHLSGLLGPDVARESAQVDAFNTAHGARAVVDAVELKAAAPEEVAEALAAVPRGITAYVEVPLHDTLDAALDAVRQHGGRAKIRTGGVTAAAFPEPEAVLRFLEGCVRRALPFKATAGLHHPVRGEQALTDAPDAPRGVMHGFLNVLGATALLYAGASATDALRLLREEDADAFRVEDGAFVWREHRLAAPILQAARALATGFGSCSFGEPVSDLRTLGLLG